jgi:hypothetical protein
LIVRKFVRNNFLKILKKGYPGGILIILSFISDFHNILCENNTNLCKKIKFKKKIKYNEFKIISKKVLGGAGFSLRNSEFVNSSNVTIKNNWSPKGINKKINFFFII